MSIPKLVPINGDHWTEVAQGLHSLLQVEINKKSTPLEILFAITDYFGGVQVYLPKSERLKKVIRDAEIYQEFNGKNIRNLAQKHNLAEQTIYRILKIQRKRNLEMTEE